MNNKNINFPLSLTEHWHNGVHIINDEVVIQKYLSFVSAIIGAVLLLLLVILIFAVRKKKDNS